MKIKATIASFRDQKWNAALDLPVDQKQAILDEDYDLSRPLYRCSVCLNEGERSLHKYINECPFWI